MSIMDDFEKEVAAKVSAALEGMGASGVAVQSEAASVEGADFAVPCFSMAKALRRSPKDIAEELAAAIEPSGLVHSVAAVNGFLNFVVDPAALTKATLDDICAKGSAYGHMPPSGVRVNVEHTSTNPTGPIHVGRARNPIIGDTLARCLKRCGHDVTTEYYVNDAPDCRGRRCRRTMQTAS